MERLDARSVTFGRLDGRLVGSASRAAGAVVLCHGYGAPATDLVPIAEEMTRVWSGAARWNWLFPAALKPLGLGMWAGRAWWDIPEARLMAMQMGGGPILDADEDPEGLGDARSALLSFLDGARAEGLLAGPLVLGGFSQGSILALDTALAMDTPPAALVIWSGALIRQSAWRAGAAKIRDIPVFQSHGMQDPLLPFEGARQLAELLALGGARIEFLSFPGGHTIPGEGLMGLAKLLQGFTPAEP